MTEPDAPSDTQATYVFAVCRNADLSAVAELPGVTVDAPVTALPLGKLTAIVQSVRAAEFTDEAWQARLSDQQALERYARAHHEVVSAVAARCPAVPLPMATLYHGEDRAREALSQEEGRFEAVLKRIERHTEWGLKVYATPSSPVDTAPAPVHRVTPTGRSSPEPGAGLAYLNRKRDVQERRERSTDEALRAADLVDAEVCRLAAASRRLRPHPQPSADRRVQVLNATYLVDERRTGELALLTQTLRDRTGAQIELSGPWVPYSFVGEVQP